MRWFCLLAFCLPFLFELLFLISLSSAAACSVAAGRPHAAWSGEKVAMVCTYDGKCIVILFSPHCKPVFYLSCPTVRLPFSMYAPLHHLPTRPCTSPRMCPRHHMRHLAPYTLVYVCILCVGAFLLLAYVSGMRTCTTCNHTQTLIICFPNIIFYCFCLVQYHKHSCIHKNEGPILYE